MAQQRVIPDDLSIPDFLRAKRGSRAADPLPQTRAALAETDPRLARLTPQLQEYVTKHRIRLSWLDDPKTLAMLTEQHDEWAARKEASRQANRARLAAIPRKVSPLRGLIPLRQILQEMGDAAPKRRHAIAAIDASKMIHTRYHWTNSPVELAHVRRVIAEFVPPVKAKGEKPQFDESAVIRWLGDGNPKKAGTGAHARWDVLIRHGGKTVGEFLAAGGNPVTLQNAILQKRAELTQAKNGAAKEERKPKLKPKSKAKAKRRST
jgi:hypothetical protein